MQRRWFRRFSYFYTINSSKLPHHLFQWIATISCSYLTRNVNIPPLHCRTNLYSNSFIPYSIKEWNNIDPDLHNLTSHTVFCKYLLKMIRSSYNNLYGVHDPVGVKMLTRIRLSFSHLGEHKFCHNFQYNVNPLCTCSLEIEDTNHFLFICPLYDVQRVILVNKVTEILLKYNLIHLVTDSDLFLYGGRTIDFDDNKIILLSTISFIKETRRFIT